jgi:TRAP-type C4-dicarboxylate transport system substrate-binding protein
MLSDQQHTTVTSTGRDAALHHRKVEWEASDRVMDQAKAAGARFNNIEISGWRDATRNLHAEYEDRIGADVMSRLRAAS